MQSAKEILALMGAPGRDDAALVEKAYEFAKKAHDGQKRFSGEPYIVHPVAVASELAKLGTGAKTVAAGLLHDTLEDAGVSSEQLEKEFGKEVLFLVEGVTKLGRFKYRGAERHRESLRKLLVATGKDLRVLIIKLMDRLHNMRTLEHVPEHKRQRIALETLEIHAAIAHRLGMGAVRRELEDLAFQYAYPDEYVKTKKILAERSKETLVWLEKMERELKKEFAKEKFTRFRSLYRTKGLFSLYRKLQRKGGDIDKIYDLAALRIIVPDISDCYRALGIVHNIWQPLPGKIKDYIAFPKPNGYRSLHTTVFTGDGGIVEIQIRTEEMHRAAEFGVASHVEYKDGARPTMFSSSFDWIKSLIPGIGRPATPGTGGNGQGPEAKRFRYGPEGVPEWIANLSEEDDDPDFETLLRSDIFSHRVFVFTPTGDVVDLPVGASVIDFAYAVHSDIGDHVSGVHVNGKLVPLDTQLHNGDIVKIETKKSANPTTKWLNFAKTALARRHIRNALEQEKRPK